MNRQERLFEAIGKADPYWVARSEKRQRPWIRYALATAACLALLLTAGYMKRRPETPNTQDHDLASPIGETPLNLPDNASGTLQLLSYAPLSQEKRVDFLIYVNEEQFSICEEGGLYSIRNTNSLPETFPELRLDILHLSGTAPDAAKTNAEASIRDHYKQVTSEEIAAALPGSLYLRASAGTDWNSEQAELWFVDDGQGGTFVLTARYFLEAEEGIGMRFRDMVSSFRVVSLSEVLPDWMRSLYETTDRLFPALLSNDLSSVSDLLAENAVVDAYGQDVWKNLTVASVDYTLDNDHDPSSATVSVKHRLNLEEGERYNYLTMELARQDGTWRLTWSGIEK